MPKYPLSPLTLALSAILLTACGGGGGNSTSSSSSSDAPAAVAAVAIPDQVDVVSASQNTTSALASAVRAALNAHAYTDATSDYSKDKQNTHIWHPALEPVESVNMILCFIGQLQADDLLNQGNYVALVDKESCEKGTSDSSSSGNQASGADQVPSFVEVTANASRASNNEPMRVKMWVPNIGDGSMIKALIEVTEAPTTAKPFGEFHISFGYFNANSTEFSSSGSTSVGGGELATTTNSSGQLGLTLYDSSEQHFDESEATATFTQSASIYPNTAQNSGVAVTQNSVSGNNLPEELSGESYAYALSYNGNHVKINKADSFENLVTNPEEQSCLNRNEFHEAVWNYNLYNSSTGARVTLNSGFPFRYETTRDSGNFDGRGHVGYWGVWTDEGELSNGQTIQKESFNNQGGSPQIYTVVTAPGRLVKNTVTALALTELDGIDFNYFDNNLGSSGYDQWVVNYLAADDTNATSGAGFYKVAGLRFGGENSPPQQTSITPEIITLPEFQPELRMWSQQLGGSVNWHEGDSNITYFAEEFIDGDETGISELFGSGDTATLYCYDSCPKGTLELNDLSSFDGPYDSPITTAMGGEVQPIQYTFSRTGTNAFTLVRVDNSETVVLASNITADALRSTFYSWGLNSGNMVTAPLADPLDIYSLSAGNVVYRWQTGLESWNHMTVVKQGDATVTFDKPLEFRYQHTSGNDRSSDSAIAERFAGQTFLLNYGGPGQLWGIPSRAVGAESEAVQDGHFRYYPAFNLKDGVLLGSSNQYVLKAIDIEQKMVRDPGACSSLGFAGLTAPPSGLSSAYNIEIGDMPTVTDAPAVVGGIVQTE